MEVDCGRCVGGGALGHPKVYINLDKEGPKSCHYWSVPPSLLSSALVLMWDAMDTVDCSLSRTMDTTDTIKVGAV